MSDAPFELDGFEPLDRIGGGGFGEVWLARQTNIDRKVAIKIGHAPIDDKTVQLRFERECIALGRLSGHPNIIDVFTAGQLGDGRPYLVLEFVNGGTLWQRLQRGPLSEPELCRVGMQLCDALGVAHDSGVLHRDLKPENVLLRQNGDAVLGDFGIARLHDGANTTSHAITASVAYAAPEILSGKSASVASDLYGIGICILASVLRSVPFVEKTDESIHPIINRVLTDKPPDLRGRGISDGLSAAVLALLEKNPDKRPANAAETKKLLALAANPPPPAPPAPQPPRGPGIGATRPIADIGAQARTSDPDATVPPRASQDHTPTPAPSANDTQIATGAPPGPFRSTGSPAPPARSTPSPTPAPTGFGPSSQHPPPPGQPPRPLAGLPAPPPRPVAEPSGPGQVQGHGQPSAPGAEQRPSPLQAQPYSPTNAPPTYGTPKPNDQANRMRVFGVAFGATLLIGGLLIFLITRLSGGDDDSQGSDITTVAPTTEGDTETAPAAPIEDTSTTSSSLEVSLTPNPATLGPLALPLTVEDFDLTGQPIITTDTEGPNTAQFCNNTPVTAGLSDWEGETYSDPQGFPSIFQEVTRFDSAAQAGAFLTSYVATVNCDEWVIPAETGGVEVTVRPVVVDNPSFAYGDDSRQINFDGEAELVTIVARAALVRRGTDVFLMSVTSILTPDLDEFDRLLEVAVDRLDY